MFKNIKFEKSNQKFADGSKEMFARIKGKTTLEEMKKETQKLSNELHKAGKKATIGISAHYSGINRWGAAKMSKAGSPVAIWNADYAELNEAYKDEYIDCVEIVIIGHAGDVPDGIKYKTPKKDAKVSDFF